MSNAKILPRQLSNAGCKSVGTSLEAILEDLKSKATSLSPQVEASAKVVLEVTHRLLGGVLPRVLHRGALEELVDAE